MIEMNSRANTVYPIEKIYVTSEPQDSQWGQPSASHYSLWLIGNRLVGDPIAGVYVPSTDTKSLDSRAAEDIIAPVTTLLNASLYLKHVLSQVPESAMLTVDEIDALTNFISEPSTSFTYDTHELYDHNDYA
jgi:hypothetical protein